jgi:Tfp pilus tip-associated adhesin PilY1
MKIQAHIRCITRRAVPNWPRVLGSALLLASGVAVAAPDAMDDFFTTDQDVKLVVPGPGVLDNDGAIGPILITDNSVPANGSVSLDADGGFTYMPNAGFAGVDTFSYTILADLATDQAVVTITVNGVNGAPSADDQAVSVDEDGMVAIKLTGSDPDGDSLTFQIDGDPAKGTLTGTLPEVTYTPAAGYEGSDSFTFTVSDGAFTSAPATVSIDVTPVNDAPVADPMTVTTPEDQATSLTLSGSDPEGDALSYDVVDTPNKGTLSGTAPNLTYTPSANATGADTFTYRVSDGSATSATAMVSITITPVNDVPVATPRSVTTTEDNSVNFSVSATDADGEPLVYTIASAPANGTLTGTPPSLNYAPVANYAGIDTFTFTARDPSNATSAPATVTISVSPVNDRPVATGQIKTTLEDTPMAITLSGTDVEGSPLTFNSISTPAKGVLSGSAPNLTYTPNPNATGSDSFTFRVNDGTINSFQGTITISITAVNDAPVSAPVNASTPEDTAVAINLPGSDVDSGTLTWIIVSTPANGTLSGAGANRTYTPNANYNGTDSFTYRVSDGSLSTAVMTASITVTPVNDPPVTGPVAATTAEDTAVAITLPGTDVDGNPLAFTIVSAPGNGTLSGSGANQTYTPNANFNGADSFTFTVSDGTVTSAPQTASITVTAVNDPPATANQALTTSEDTPLAIVLAGFDADGDALTFTVVGAPASGALTGSGANLTYTPDGDFNGADSFTFTVSDGVVTTAPATVSITVDAVNDEPTVAGQSVSTDEDTAVGITLAGSDTEGDDLTFNIASGPSHGTLSGTAPNLTYTPTADYHGSDSFQFSASDAASTSDPATVDITIAPVNDAPTVVAPIGEVRGVEDGADVTVDVSGAFGDVDIATDGDTLTFALVSLSVDTAGLFTAQSFDDSTLTLDPAPDRFGTATVTVSATDSSGASVTDTFTVVIEAINDVPAAEDDSAAVDENADSVAIAVLDNDFVADGPATIVSVGTGGYSDSAPMTILDVLGNPVTWPDGSQANGRVTVDGNQVIYEPKPHFHGTDTFTYTIADADGDESTATVTVTVNAINDAPEGPQERVFYLQEGGELVVDTATGLLANAYDADNHTVDEDGVTVVTQTLSMQTLTVPDVGLLDIDNVEGTFTYTPPVDFTGEVSFTYVLTDGESFSDPASRVRVVVTAAPPPADPPVPGEVAVTFNLANVPLEQSAGVPPNVLVVMDDSFSMDYQMVVPAGADESLMLLDNSPVRNRPVAQAYGYLYDLASNSMQATTSAGSILPTEEVLNATAGFVGNQYGVWRARNHLYNTLYYNPANRYTPWTGSDVNNATFANATPSAVRLDPVDPSRTVNILNTLGYTARNVPRWSNSGSASGSVAQTGANALYIPHYYTTTADAPLAWNAPHTKVEIRDNGNVYAGGPDRTDCAVGDSDPATCTYAQEIQNFANWFQYYRTREYVTKASMGKVVAQVQDVRVGYLTTSNPTSEDIRDMNTLYTEGNKKLLIDNIYSVDSSSQGSPQRQLLDRAGAIFACQYGSYCPQMDGGGASCQQNFALLMTDGYWSQGNGYSQNADADEAGNAFDGGRYADSYSATLADTAMYWYKRDINPDADDLVPVGRRDVLGAPDGTFDSDQPLMHQHMKTYTIAFGVVGSIDESSIPADPTTAFAWPDPMNAPAYKIDDVLHAAINGRGQYLNASNPRQLQSALESAFLEFTQAASSTSSAAFNSTSLEEGTLLYRGFYDLRYNIGELTATRVATDGTLASAPLWKASEALDDKSPSDRVIVSYDPLDHAGVAFRFDSLTDDQKLTLTADQVEFMRGARDDESPTGDLRERETTGGLLGDIVNSSPVFVGPPRSINRDQNPYPVDDLYSDFAAEAYSRTPLVYVGSNDGMMHGFHAGTGEELFAFVPNKLIDGTRGYRNALSEFTSPFYQHRMYVDLTPRLNDAFVRTPSSPTDKVWSTILMGGLGAGGKGFFALDVTDPDIFASEASARDAVMWEFTDEDDTYPVDALGDPLGGSVGARLDPLGNPVKDLGNALALPSVVMSNVDDGGSPAEKEWIGVFGNGPNSTAGFAKLFVLFLDKGIDGWDDGDVVKIDTGYGVPLSPHSLTGFPNGLGTPSAVDADLNGTVDFVYAGDRLGNLFRFDLRDEDPDNWFATRIFTASYSNGVTTTIQPILSQPLVIKHPSEQGFMVIFGTGSYVTRDDARSEDIQSIYAIWDRGESNPATAAADTRETRLVEQELTNIFDNTITPNVTRRVFLATESVEYRAQDCAETDCSGDDDDAGTYGWFVDLDMPRATESVTGTAVTDTAGRAPPEAQYPGERAIRRFLIRDGNIITTTVLPALDEFSCFGTRPGAILVMSALDGGDVEEPLIDFNNDGVINAQDLLDFDGEQYSAGLLLSQDDLGGQLVDLSTLGGVGGTDFLFVSGGSDTVAYLIEGIEDMRTGRLSWRELDFAN